MKIFINIIILIFLAGCKESEKSSSEGSRNATRVLNTLSISLTSHLENQTYSSGNIYFDAIVGSITAEDYVGALSIKWETSVSGVTGYSGFGGFSSSTWSDGSFSGSWNIYNLKIIENKINKVRVTISDLAGNSTYKEFFINCIIAPPSLIILGPGANGSWVSGGGVNINGSLDSDVEVSKFEWSNNTSMASGDISILADWSNYIPLVDGINSIDVSVEDIIGKVNTQSITVGLDNTAPIVTPLGPIANSYQVTTSLSPVSFSGTALDSQAGVASLSWTNEATSGTGIPIGLTDWSIIDLPVIDGENRIILKAIDNVGNINDHLLNYIVDRSAPTLLTSSFKINNGADSTIDKNILIDLTISDSLSRVTSVCFKHNDFTTPVLGDSCWKIIGTKSKNLTIDDHPYELGSTSMPYKIYAWAQDEAQNISSLSNDGKGTIGQDMAQINYSAGPSATVSNFSASKTDTPNSPLKTADITVLAGEDLFIKWNIVDDEVLPNASINLFYTEDDVNYISIVSGLNNEAGPGCSVISGHTGCYKWTASVPTSTYFKLRLVVTDAAGGVSFGSSNTLNSGGINFITGNTDLGLNGSAANGIFFTAGEANYNDAADPGALVVTSTGIVFVRDQIRGLLYIKPNDGIVRQLIPETGSYSGDGGPVADATFKNFAYMALDFKDRVIVWDGSRVRRIDLSTNPWTIERIFGGGSDTSNVANALDANIPYRGTNNMILTPTPSGRIYFNKTYRDIWYYDDGTKEVVKHRTLSGLGTRGNSNFDNSICSLSHLGISFDVGSSELTSIVARTYRGGTLDCGSDSSSSNMATNFDPITGVATLPHPVGEDYWSAHKYTGMDGKLYLMQHGRDNLETYNLATHIWDYIMGVDRKPGRCLDGTLMTDCNMKLMSLFVNSSSVKYFIDMGVIRYVDSNNRVQTLGGQPRNFGVGFAPLSARYARIDYFTATNDYLYIKDSSEQQLVRIPLSGGNVEHVAGNGINSSATDGSNSLTSPMNNCKWAVSCGFQINSTGTRLYHSIGTKVFYLDLITYTWHSTGVSNNAQTLFNGINSTGEFLVYNNGHYGSTGDRTQLMTFDPMAPSLTSIYGSSIAAKNGSATICNDGSVGTDCLIGYSHNNNIAGQYKYDSLSNNWMIYKRSTKTIHEIPNNGGVVTLLATTNKKILSFEHRRALGDRLIYYCADDGKIYKKNLTSLIEVEVPIGINSVKCSGNALFYHADRESLMFIYKQNNLYGIAELTNQGD